MYNIVQRFSKKTGSFRLMKIVIDNTQFEYNTGCRLLKLKYATCPFPEMNDIWEQIIPMSFREIATLANLEQRRVGVMCLGLERLAAEVKPKLLDRQVIKKTTTWVKQDGTLETVNFDDVYELFEVDGEYFNEGIKSDYEKVRSCHFVKCKDTSTDRTYFIWVDLQSVWNVNCNTKGYTSYSWGGIDDDKKKDINAIMCIAWTMQTNVPQGFIEKIVRQGDCIMIKPKTSERCETRHLTEKEYRTLLVAES